MRHWMVPGVALLAMACGSEDPGTLLGGSTGTQGTTPGFPPASGQACSSVGSQQACSCQGAAGTQLCHDNFTWSACLCGSGVLPGAGGAMSPVAGAGGAAGAAGAAGSAVAGSGAAGVGAAGVGAAGMGVAGMDMAGTGGSVAPPTGGPEPAIPSLSASCPTIATGNVQVMGQSVQLWVGARREDVKGPVFFYWHGTGSNSGEAVGGLGAALNEIQSQGGVVASFTTTTRQGQNTGNNVWYTGDFEMADVILACAVQQLNIDTRRIYTGGCSAGGLQASTMVYGRSSYLAGAMPNSGGVVFAGQLEDPDHVPAVITSHGAPGVDVVVIDFSDTSARFVSDISAKGGFAVNCNHGGGHCRSPANVKAAQWEFLKAHPFGTSPSPYSGGLPPSFPTVCTIK